MAAIYTMDGAELCAGLQGCNVSDEAILSAQRHADELGADVHLVDDDGEWVVHPAIGRERDPADVFGAAAQEAQREPTGAYWVQEASSSTPSSVANVCGSDAREVRDENALLVAVFVNGEDADLFVGCVNAHDARQRELRALREAAYRFLEDPADEPTREHFESVLGTSNGCTCDICTGHEEPAAALPFEQKEGN